MSLAGIVETYFRPSLLYDFWKVTHVFEMEAPKPSYFHHLKKLTREVSIMSATNCYAMQVNDVGCATATRARLLPWSVVWFLDTHHNGHAP
jgi:hypothetical protein